MGKMDNPAFAQHKEACSQFWTELSNRLKERGYILQLSDTGTTAEYLLKEGDEKYLTWRNKPRESFRIANFWSWYANTETCLAPAAYIQCLNADFGRIKPRHDPVKGTSPRMGWAVAYTKDGYYYHTVFGKKYDRSKKQWVFITPTVDEVLEELGF